MDGKLMDDLIGRQAAIMHFVKASKNYECGMFDLEEVTHELWQLPSARPEQKKGRWIERRDTRFGPKLNYIIICSNCNIAFSGEDMIRRSFCPNCGADMRKEQADG